MRSLSRTTSMLLASCALAACSGHTAANSGGAAPAPTAICRRREGPRGQRALPVHRGRRPLHVGNDRPPRAGDRDGAVGADPRRAARRCGFSRERIINAQQDEIATMQQWLARSASAGARGESRSDEDDDERNGARDADARHAHREQMKQLDAARGAGVRPALSHLT